MKFDSREAMIERRQEPQRAPHWETLSKLMDSIIQEDELMQFSAEGWELVSVIAVAMHPPKSMYHFKRRRA